jgi:hypothetical protein
MATADKLCAVGLLRRSTFALSRRCVVAPPA